MDCVHSSRRASNAREYSSRERAELLARSMVDRWHERAAGKAVRSKEARRIAANIAKLPELVHQRNGAKGSY
jgi:hypothetical protein